jgi:hypothetical protein
MFVYIIGHKGWIGRLFMKALENDKHLVAFSEFRAESDEIKQDILNSKCSHVLYCAGRTSGGSCKTVDYLEDPTTLKENINDNLYAPLAIAMFCDLNDIHFTYIGTGLKRRTGPISLDQTTA